MKKYVIAFILAIVVHVIAGAGLVWSFGFKPKTPDVFKIPEHIQATLVVLDKPKIVKNNQNDKKQTLTKAEDAAKKEAEKKRQEDAKKKAEAAKKVEAEKLAKEKAAKEKAAKEKAESEQKAKEKAQKEAEVKKQAEEARKAEELKQQQAAEKQKKEQAEAAKREESLLEGLDEEDSQIEQQTKDEATATTYYELIRSQISVNWSRPASARNGMVVGIELHLLPNGELQDVFITQSSGDAGVDRSAEVAVRKVRKFQVPDDPQVFEKYFRVFSFGFRVEDLMR